MSPASLKPPGLSGRVQPSSGAPGSTTRSIRQVDPNRRTARATTTASRSRAARASWSRRTGSPASKKLPSRSPRTTGYPRRHHPQQPTEWWRLPGQRQRQGWSGRRQGWQPRSCGAGAPIYSFTSSGNGFGSSLFGHDVHNERSKTSRLVLVGQLLASQRSGCHSQHVLNEQDTTMAQHFGWVIVRPPGGKTPHPGDPAVASRGIPHNLVVFPGKSAGWLLNQSIWLRWPKANRSSGSSTARQTAVASCQRPGGAPRERGCERREAEQGEPVHQSGQLLLMPA